jgi:hypothetical protein
MPTPEAKAKATAKAKAKAKLIDKTQFVNNNAITDTSSPGSVFTKSSKRLAKLYKKWETNATGLAAIEVEKPSTETATHFAAAVDADRISARAWTAIEPNL